MQRILSILVVLITTSSCQFKFSITSNPREAARIETVEANRNFTNNFYNRINSERKGDIFFSPLSIHAALSALFQGASGSTFDALANTLETPTPYVAAEGYEIIIRNLVSSKFANFRMVNKFFISDAIRLRLGYQDIVKNYFFTDIASLNCTDSKASANEVNYWVNRTTNGAIRNVVRQDDFSSNTRLMVVTSLHLKANWHNSFNELESRSEPFFIDFDTEVSSRMMHTSGRFLYKDDDEFGAQIVEIPFQGEEFQMVIVLPQSIFGIVHLERNIEKYGLNKMFENMEPAHVKVALPKFTIDSKICLENYLTEMGLGILFERENCMLDKIVYSDEELPVSKIVQKIHVDINEQGINAGTSPGVIVDDEIEANVNVYANHPFIVIIKSRDDIIYYGKIMKPLYTGPQKSQVAIPASKSTTKTAQPVHRAIIAQPAPRAITQATHRATAHPAFEATAQPAFEATEQPDFQLPTEPANDVPLID